VIRERCTLAESHRSVVSTYHAPMTILVFRHCCSPGLHTAFASPRRALKQDLRLFVE